MRFDLTVNEFTRSCSSGASWSCTASSSGARTSTCATRRAAVHAVLEAPVERVAGQVFNVGDTNENYRKADLVELMSERVPDADVEHVHKTEDPRDYRVSFERIHEHLGFRVDRTRAGRDRRGGQPGGRRCGRDLDAAVYRNYPPGASALSARPQRVVDVAEGARPDGRASERDAEVLRAIPRGRL